MPGLKLSEAEYRELKFRSQKSDMELFEEGTMKPENLTLGAHDKGMDTRAEREGYLSDAELIEEGKIQAARELHIKMVTKPGRGKTNKELIEQGIAERAKLSPAHPVTCPDGQRSCSEYCYDNGFEERWIEEYCPLWIESEAMCSQKLKAIALNQIANIMSQRR